MKKFRFMLITLLILVCSLSVFAACGGNKNNSSSGDISISNPISESSSSADITTESSAPSSSAKPSSSSVKPSSSKPSSSSSKPAVYTITVTSSTGGTVTASKNSAEAGTSIVLTVKATDTSYVLEWVKVNGTKVNLNGNTYTFTLNQNTTVTYSFVKTYSISIGTITNGTVIADKQTAKVGDTVNFTITPNSNYILKSFKINGTETTVTDGKVAYTMTAKDVTVTAEFQRVYTIVKGAETNGTFTLSSTSAVAGTEITVTATPATNYVTSEISITHGTTTIKLDFTDNKVTFAMPAEEVTVNVVFAKVDSREYVSHLIFGDSYTHHQPFFRNFYTDMQDLPSPKILGIGGTQIPQWGKTGTTTFQNIHLNTAFTGQGGLDGKILQFGVERQVNISSKYNVQNFVFHIGINDINGGTPAAKVINDLKILFTQYHEAYPSANIYWISLSLITCNLNSIAAVKEVNAAMAQYASQTSYLNYINTVDYMFPDGQPNGDWFNGDGLHFNADGYVTWSSLILQGLGYPRKDIGTAFGSAGKLNGEINTYYSHNNWKDNNGIISNSFDIPVNNTDISLEGGATTVTPFTEQSLWFKDVYSVDAYAELEVTANKVAFNDPYPKFGLALKGLKTHVFLFVDALNGLNGTGVSFTERKLKVNDGGVSTAIDWDWSIQKWGSLPSGATYTGGKYIKLGLLRTGTEIYFLVNDQIVLDISNREFTSDAMTIGFTTFATEVSIKNYSVTTNVASKLSSLNIKKGGSAYFTGNKDTLDVTTGPDVLNLVENFTGTNFHYEATIKANSVIGTDEYPKFGLVLVSSSGSQLFFYVDAVNTGAFGSVKNVGFVHKAAGAADWTWAVINLTYVPTISYGNGSEITMGIYKQGSRIVGLINGVAVLDVSRYSDMAGAVGVGYLGFNIDADVRESKLATSATMLGIISKNYGITNDLTIDGDLSDWSATQKASPYTCTSTDNTGRGFTIYAFMGTNGIYVGYEIKHNNFVNNLNDWWLNTNAEMFVGTAKIQAYTSANGASLNVVSSAIKSSTTGSLKTTVVELVLSYGSGGYAGTENSVLVGFACKTGGEKAPGMTEGNEGDWWCGPKHATNGQSTVAKSGGIS